MPNWITNTITSDRMDIVKEKLCTVQDGEEIVDFNIIKPMPKELLDTTSGCFQWERRQNPWNEKKIIFQNVFLEPLFKDLQTEDLQAFLSEAKALVQDKCYDKFIEVYEITDNFKEEGLTNILKGYFNLKNYGSVDWYDWSIKNWGTKWNACHSLIGENCISFDTAWGYPLEVLLEVSKYADIKVAFADEDLGNNFGIVVLRNGSIDEIIVDDDVCADMDWTKRMGIAVAIKGYDEEFISDYFSEYNYSDEEIQEFFQKDRETVIDEAIEGYNEVYASVY